MALQGTFEDHHRTLPDPKKLRTGFQVEAAHEEESVGSALSKFMFWIEQSIDPSIVSRFPNIQHTIVTMSFFTNQSTSELNTHVNPTTCLGDTGCWIQQVTAPTLVVTCWIHQCASILPSTCTGGRSPPL